MGRSSVKYTTLLIILFVFSVASVSIQLFSPILQTKVDLSKVPLDIGEWSGKDIRVDDATKKELETDSVLFREYKNGGNQVWLLVVYYGDSRVSLSLPECYSAGYGAYVEKRDTYDVGFPIKRMVVEGTGWKKVLFYYFETSNLKSGTYWAMRWQMILNRLKSRNNSGALIRISTRVKINPEKTTGVLKEFMQQLAPLLSNQLFYK
jgi:EpsI family protein